MLAAQVRRLHSGLMLLQNPNDLLFRVSALLHRSPPSQITGELQFSLAEFLGSRSAGLALLAERRSGCTLALVAGFLSLSNIPLGTTLGIYTLVMLLPIAATQRYGRSD